MLYWHEGWVGERARRQAPPAPPGAAPPPPRVLAVPGEARGVVLGGLRPWSRYRLRVLVFNGRGDGPPSDEISFDTPEGGESPPAPGATLWDPRSRPMGPSKNSEPPQSVPERPQVHPWDPQSCPETPEYPRRPLTPS